MTKVSVVIPSYNHGKYIAQCVESVLGQSYSDLELVITDDASTDDTVARIQEFPDPRVRLHAFPKNLGQCVALNASIRRSTGEYIAVLNSDDYFAPGKLERQVSFLDTHTEYGAVFSMPCLVDENGAKVTGHRWSQRFRSAENTSRYEWLRRFFLVGNSLCHPTVMIRRSCHDKIGLYDARLAQMPDLDLWFRLCRDFEIYLLPQELTCFRVRDNASNASAERPEVSMRSTWEGRCILERLLGIDRATFSQIFPEADQSDLGRSVDSLIAEVALQVGTPFHAAFALDTLYRELGKAVDKRRYREFLRLTSQLDVYNLFPDRLA